MALQQKNRLLASTSAEGCPSCGNPEFPSSTPPRLSSQDHRDLHPQRFRSWILPLLFVVLGIAAIAGYERPFWNFDMLPYAGIAYSARTSNFERIHRDVYAEAQARAPRTVDLQIPFHADLRANASHFAQQFPFYNSRPGYILAIRAIHALGFDFFSAMRLVSATSYFFLGLLITFWLSRYLALEYACGAVILLFVSPPVYSLCRFGTPDALSALVLVAGTYALLETTHLALASGLLLGSILVRGDNIIFVACILGLHLAMYSERPKIPRSFAAVLVLVGVALVLTMNRVSGSYGLAMLFRNSFFGDPVSNPAEFVVRMSPHMYLLGVWGLVCQLVERSSLLLFLLFAALTCVSTKRPGLRHLCLTLLGAITVHLLLYPSAVDRYFSAHELIIFVAMLVSILGTTPNGRFSNENETGMVESASC